MRLSDISKQRALASRATGPNLTPSMMNSASLTSALAATRSGTILAKHRANDVVPDRVPYTGVFPLRQGNRMELSFEDFPFEPVRQSIDLVRYSL